MQPARIKLHAKEHTNNPVQRPNFRGQGTKRDPRKLIAEFYLVDRGLRHRLPGFVYKVGLRLFLPPWYVHVP